MKYAAAALALVLVLVLYREEEVSEFELDLGEHSCTFSVKRYANAPAALIALHDDENTCIEAHGALPDSRLFHLIEVKQAEKRLLTYKNRDAVVYFDPNRIFSDAGIRKTLNLYNRNSSPALESAIRTFADTLLTLLLAHRQSDYVIAAHNNSDNQFSVLSYLDSPEAQAVFICPEEDVDNFILVTEAYDFAFFKHYNTNTVLLADSGYEDDGSLSVYCLKNGIPYINIEVEHGNREKQLELLQRTHELMVRKRGVEKLERLPKREPRTE